MPSAYNLMLVRIFNCLIFEESHRSNNKNSTNMLVKIKPNIIIKDMQAHREILNRTSLFSKLKCISILYLEKNEVFSPSQDGNILKLRSPSAKSNGSNRYPRQKVRSPKRKILISKSREVSPRILKLDEKINPKNDIIFDISIFDRLKKNGSKTTKNEAQKSHRKSTWTFDHRCLDVLLPRITHDAIPTHRKNKRQGITTKSSKRDNEI